MVTTLRSDPATSEEEHFKLVLVQTEMERVKYLVRSYVRCRLSKVGPVSRAGSVHQRDGAMCCARHGARGGRGDRGGDWGVLSAEQTLAE
jgi:hypothetical protein